MVEIDEIYRRVINLFDEEVRDLDNSEYRNLVESLADEFQTRYDVIMEEMTGDDE
jgi:hypothetical protein